MTTYIILRQDEIGHWVEDGETEASGDKRAIRAHTDEQGVRFVAIPKRSWHPRLTGSKTHLTIT